jgi:hypothetical protein
MPPTVSRRTVLKGLGTAIALPWLEAMGLGAPAKKAPRRLAFLYVPNGVHVPDWTPKTEGAGFELPYLLEALQPHREYVTVLTGLALDKARANGDGPGDHARANATFLTGVQIRKTDGANIRAGVSVDQVAATQIGTATKLPSLEIGIEGGRQAGNCDSGYSCAYSSNLSWRGEATPMVKEIDPRQVFERLFGTGGNEAEAGRAKRDRYKQSILDLAAEDAKQLKGKLGATDQRKMDEYLTAVRELERRIGRAEKEATPLPNVARPAGIPKEYEGHLKLMADLLALAFQADVTRIATFALANDGSNRSYKFLDVPEGHHDLSHHGRDKEKQEKIKKINRFHVAQLAYLLDKLKGVKEADGSNLLDNLMLVYGSGIGDGDRHNHDDLPILLIGKGGGTVRVGRHLRYKKDTPLCNLYLSLLDRVGAKADSFGDSTGRLTDLG